MPSENTITFRQPATANLMLDSYDRNANLYVSPWNFQITRTNALMNGFFTRVATTEVVLEWCEHNITDIIDLLNNEIIFDLSGTGGNTFTGNESITLSNGWYTVEETLDEIVNQLNDLSGTTGMVFSILNTNGQILLDCSGGVFTIPEALQQAAGSVLAEQLDILQETFVASKDVQCPDLRPYRYIDFVSQQLTYNQDLKDSTTNSLVRDVLCRWYMASDVPDALDGYGFPILMGYKPFVARRLFNPPKQIRWSNNQPMGNLAFQVYGFIPGIGISPQPIGFSDAGSNWLMTLQVSEN